MKRTTAFLSKLLCFLLVAGMVISLMPNIGAPVVFADTAAAANTNPNVPKDSDYVFFLAGSPEEEKYMYGTGSDYKASFNSTHEGMGYNQHEGGLSSKLPHNARLFNGQYITYEFDLIDSAKEARLKVYGVTGMTFTVSTDDGATWTAITPAGGPIGSGRGYYVFNLSQTDALKDGDRKFLLKMEGESGIFLGLMIQTEEPVLTKGAHFEIDSEDSLRFLESSDSLRTYYADKAFANYIIDDKGYTIYKVPFHESIREAVFYATYSGDVHIEIAGEDGQYEMLLDSTLGPSGTPHTNVYDLSGYLEKSNVLYFRLSGSAAGGFLDSMGIAVTPKDEEEGGFTVFAGGEANYLYDMAKNELGIGLTKRVTVGYEKGRGVDAGSKYVIYRLDLADDAGGVDLFVDAVGTYVVTVSTDGKEYVAPAEVDGGLRVVEPLEDSVDKVLYVKITNVSDSVILQLKGMTFTTKNIVVIERPTTPDFGYDEEPTEEPTAPPTTIPATKPSTQTPDENPEEPSNGLWFIIGGVALVAVIILVVAVLNKKKNNQK